MKKLIIFAALAGACMTTQAQTCGAKTKANTECKAHVKVMGMKCWRHDPDYVKKPESQSVTCKGTKKDGDKCTLKTKHASGYCHHHRPDVVGITYKNN